jgi:hypothetical protein
MFARKMGAGSLFDVQYWDVEMGEMMECGFARGVVADRCEADHRPNFFVLVDLAVDGLDTDPIEIFL